MAAVMSDFHTEFRFHGHAMLAGSSQQISPTEATYRHRSCSRLTEKPWSPRPHKPAGIPPPSATTQAIKQEESDEVDVGGSAAENLPSPPLSSSPKPESYSKEAFMSQQEQPVAPKQQPYDPPDILSDTKSKTPLPSSTTHAPTPRSVKSLDVKNYSGKTIKVKDLAHIQSFANENFSLFGGQTGRRKAAEDPMLKYEISGMPITDIIEMVAGLLTKITTTNDHQHENLHRPSHVPEGTNLPGLSNSVLAFHGKNVPSITILSYLSRTHKYCPTTYEVFLSMLIYFDRMTERVNSGPLEALRKGSTDQDKDVSESDVYPDQESSSPPSATSYSVSGSDLADSPPSAKSNLELKDELDAAQYKHDAPAAEIGLASNLPLSHFFVVDSFNIHRLVIAGVTCASKFFSDVFYTNSRYAKVGGLPLPELNHLELQFLLLNDFRLSIPVEELEAYGTMLVEFYAREVVVQREGTPIDLGGESDEVKAEGSEEKEVKEEGEDGTEESGGN